MGVTAKWRSGVATDPGLVRRVNEDRHYVDDEAGVFLVIDGVGGKAAGEVAAETAVEEIRAYLQAAKGTPEARIAEAITRANNTIHDLAHGNPEWRGMGCVLTLAVLEDDEITIGHVGDSRLYLIWNGAMRKLTADHSPVGEGEDSGELTESEAMAHPRRNEVFRDVGSRRHEPGDAEFIDIRRCQFKPEAAILLCSDGLSDCLTTAEMVDVIERYDGDPAGVARELVEAANAAGGKDNITALFVAGSEFVGRDTRMRHAVTRRRVPPPVGRMRRMLTGRLAFLVYGVILGMLLAAALVRWPVC